MSADRMEWSEGMRVEACRSENEFRRAWFEGVIVSANPEGRVCKICYDKIVTQAGQPLVEDVCPSHLRPIPPHAFPLHCSAGDAVEAYENNCWLRGVIIRLVPSEEELWAVYLLDSCIIKACRRSDLRPALQWQGGTWTVLRQERDTNIEEVARFLTMDKAPKVSFPNEAHVTAVPRRGRPVSHRGRGRMRTQNVNFELTELAGDNSKISCRGRKKRRLVASIVPRGIQEDIGDNSRISCAGKKLKQIAKFVPPHIQEDARNNSTISGEREKLRIITDIMPHRIQEPSETRETWNDVMALDYQKENDIDPRLFTERDSSKRVDEERNCRESPMANAIQNLETDGEARRLDFSESKGREMVLLSKESTEECPQRSNSKINDCGVPMENNCNTSDKEENVSEGHKCELLVYQKMSWAFHTDSGIISRDRLNLLDGLRLRLNITQNEHKMAMEEALVP